MIESWLRFVVLGSVVICVSSQVVLDGGNVTHELQGEGKFPFYMDEDYTWNRNPIINASIDYDGGDLDEEDSEVFEDDSPYEEFGLWDYALDNGETGVVDYNNITEHFIIFPIKPERRCSKCQCGVKFGKRIVGGTFTKPFAFPWLILLRQNGRFVCGGTIICNRFIVTAAHCMTSAPRTYTVVLHVYNRVRPGPRAVYRKISRIYRSRYQPNTNNRDIALLQLSKPVKLGARIRPICLPTNRRRSYAGRNAVVAGWGLTQNNRYPRIPKKVVVPVLSNRKCKRTKVGRLITKYMLCAGRLKGGRDSCSGDSGGPLMLKVNKRFTLIGIVSFGIGCAGKNSPGVYTRVNRLLGFISAVTKGKCCYCKA